MTKTHFELKDCPFCGQEAYTQKYQDESVFSHAEVTYLRIYCAWCGVACVDDEIEEEAINRWNTRVNKEAEILEELKRLCNEQSMRASGEQISDVVYVDDVIVVIEQFQAEQKNNNQV